jgi:magnesium transporter
MLAQVVRDWTPSDLAELVESLPTADQVLALRHLSRPQAIATFQYLIPAAQQRLLQRLANDEASEMLNALPHDDLTLLLSELKTHESGEVLRLLAPQKRHSVKSLLEYPEDSAGRLMTPAYLAIRPDWTVQHTCVSTGATGKLLMPSMSSMSEACYSMTSASACFCWRR